MIQRCYPLHFIKNKKESRGKVFYVYTFIGLYIHRKRNIETIDRVLKYIF